ncbi:MAG: diguanylate cyclase [Lysobacter sp.]
MLRFILLTALYVLCTWYAEAFILGPAQVTLFWPAAGVAFAAVLRYGWRWSLFIPVAALVAHLIFVKVPASFLPFSVLSNLLGALTGAYVVRAARIRSQVSVASVFAMLRGGTVMVLVSAAIGTTGLVLSGMVPLPVFWPAYVKWSMGDLLGIVCIAPSMLLLATPVSNHPDLPRPSDYASANERVAWVVVLSSSYGFVYWAGLQNSAYALGMIALPLSVLLWSAFRFQPIWTAVGTATAIFFMTSLTGLGLAGFRSPTTLLDSVLLLGFMTLFATVPLVLVASINEQRVAARRELRRATADAEAQRIELERQVVERTQQLHAANLQLEEASQTDPLTGLRNRRYLTNQIPADLAFYDREQARTGRSDDALVFALVDIDHFKRINDTYGHKAGDRVLQQFSQVMTRLVRVGDYVVRWGGEEFLLVFRPIPRHHVATLGERIRRSATDQLFDVSDDLQVPLTCSVGLAEYPLFRDAQQQLGWEQMIELADAALYWVKQNGRNGWAALRPTEHTDLVSLADSLQLGAQALIDSRRLVIVGSHNVVPVPESAPRSERSPLDNNSKQPGPTA